MSLFHLIDKTNSEIDIYDKVKLIKDDNYLANYIEYSDFFRKVILYNQQEILHL